MCVTDGLGSQHGLTPPMQLHDDSHNEYLITNSCKLPKQTAACYNWHVIGLSSQAANPWPCDVT